MSEWISIAEKLPPENEIVALLDTSRWVNTGHADFDCNVYAAGYLISYGALPCQKSWNVHQAPRGMVLDAFTHWMPLPPPPEV